MKKALIKYALVSFILLFQCQLLLSSKIEISGNAKGHENVHIFLLTYSDLYTKTLEQKAVSIIGEDGKFTLSAEIGEIEYACIRFNHLNAFLYLQPGKNYDLNMLPLPEGQNVSMNNKTQVPYTFSSLDEDDINKLILGFNYEYDLFFNQNYDLLKEMAAPPSSHFKRMLQGDSVQLTPSVKGRSKQQILATKVHSFEDEMNEKYSTTVNSFFQIHRKMVIADLHYQLKGDDNILFDSYLKDSPWYSTIPEFVNFTRNYYDKYFANYVFKWGDNSLVRHIENGETEAVKLLLKKDDFIANDQMLEFVLCHAIYETTNSRQLKKEGMYKILEEIAKSSSSQNIQNLARSVMRKMTKTSKGFPAYDFVIPNHLGEDVSLSDHSGKHVMINFWSDQCNSCSKEMSLISDLNEKYRKHIAFISIGIDLEQNDLSNYLSKHRKYTWTFLDGSNDASLNDNFDIYSLPQFMVIDESGKFVNAYAKKPSEGLEEILYSIFQKKELEKKNRRKVGRK